MSVYSAAYVPRHVYIAIYNKFTLIALYCLTFHIFMITEAVKC